MAYGVMSIFYLGINITKRTKHFSYIIGSGGLLNVALNVVLIPRYGMMGAGASLLLAYVGTMVLSAYVAQRFYPVPYEFGRMGRIAGVFVAAGVLTTLVQFEQPLADLAFRLFALVAFGGGLVAAGVFSQTDVTALRRLYAGMRRERGLRAKVRFGVEQFRPD